eukprot:240985-Pleurochrysis_carterae.AAC.1
MAVGLALRTKVTFDFISDVVWAQSSKYDVQKLQLQEVYSLAGSLEHAPRIQHTNLAQAWKRAGPSLASRQAGVPSLSWCRGSACTWLYYMAAQHKLLSSQMSANYNRPVATNSEASRPKSYKKWHVPS